MIVSTAMPPWLSLVPSEQGNAGDYQLIQFRFVCIDIDERGDLCYTRNVW